MNTVMRILLRPCKKTTELIDKQMFTPLTLKEKVQLQAHKAMCGTCNAYEKQSKLLEDLIGKWFATDSYKKYSTLDEDKKNKIIEEIKKI
ncbi:hypothetical protein H4V97_003063 [Flavobacterium sp. CG_23.5]|uniref:hypothetical protein n=1 Tax=unclassified Flavobacterium TaxID=196869 RepID=UPI0018CBEADF|nr:MULTISPECIES: hypothetical protein [unclassified Flavobacterium]MBG6109711.1 hypothetical protein [Flavobacterium sp. CG_9.10]MBP2284745.1 hypothetical protein [Flavobacterium sp. CG_23.5]